MFVQHRQLKDLNVPASRVARLNTSGGSNVQMAFPGFPPQMCGAYLVALSSGNKILVVVAFYLSESREAIFYVPQKGEVSVEDAEATFDEGLVFAETMGFVLSETDYHMLSSEGQQKLWGSLPISQTSAQRKAKLASRKGETTSPETENDPLDEYRERSLKSLGRFLSSM